MQSAFPLYAMNFDCEILVVTEVMISTWRYQRALLPHTKSKKPDRIPSFFFFLKNFFFLGSAWLALTEFISSLCVVLIIAVYPMVCV